MDGPTIALYTAHAGEWAAARGGPTDDAAARFRRRVGNGVILDAGCGVGRYLAGLGAPAVGLDATRAMLDLAVGKGMPLACGDLEHLPFAGGTFAGLFARHSYLHIPKERARAAFVEAARVVRPGGSLLLTMIAGGYEGRALPGDDFPGRWFTLWGETELTAALRCAGFSDVRVEEVTTRRGHDLVATGSRDQPLDHPRGR